jgi:hypothetical protein
MAHFTTQQIQVLTQSDLTVEDIREMENFKSRVKEYKLMYFFGGWVTSSVICAECDAEAIFDADSDFNNSKLQNWSHGVALWCGNRKVKTYREGI